MKLTDKRFEDIKERLNAAIHELVFAVHHADNDAPEEALNSLMTVQETVNQVSEELADLEEVEG